MRWIRASWQVKNPDRCANIAGCNGRLSEVSEEKIALALDLNPRSIVRKAKLLDGICEEAVGILKNKHCATAVFEILRKMKAMRQIEAAELMMNANNYSPAYISAILAGTP